MAAVNLGKGIRDLDAVLVRLGRTRQSVVFAVGHQVGEVHVRSGGVGAGSFEVAAPLEAECVDGGIGDGGIPVGHKDALVEDIASVGGDRAVVGRRRGGVGDRKSTR